MSLRTRKVLLILATLGFWATGLLLASYLAPPTGTIIVVVTSLIAGAALALIEEEPQKWAARFRRR